MKKPLYLLGAALPFLLAVPAYADVQWPPPPADIPPVVCDASVYADMFSSLKASLGAMTNTGLLLSGVIISFILISRVFFDVVLQKLALLRGVDKREFNRKVSAEDRRRNLDSIGDDRVAAKEVEYLAKNRFRLKHPGLDLNEKIYQRELSYQADLEMEKRHPERALEKSIKNRKIAAQANIDFNLEHHNLAVNNRVSNREISAGATAKFNLRNPNYVTDKAVYDRWASANAEMNFLRLHPDVYMERRKLKDELDKEYRKSKSARKSSYKK